MSNGQQQTRVRLLASPSLKSGPLKATLPLNTFVLRQGNSPTTVKSCGRKGQSPPTSPIPTAWSHVPESLRKNPRSPDHRSSPDRSGSPFIIKDKSRSRHSPVPLIKRTSSLDAITSPYLKGEWPREAITPSREAIAPVASASYHTLAVPDTAGMVRLTEEQATQTPEEWWEDSYDRRIKPSHMRSTSLGNPDTLIKKEQIRTRLTKSKEVIRTSGHVSRISPVQGNHGAIIMTTVSTTTYSKAVSIPHIPKPTIHIRGSVEGLSQEIEKLVLKHNDEQSIDYLIPRPEECTPDGHRAPIAELLCTTRTIDTQTPAVEDVISLGVHEESEEVDDRSSSDSFNDTRSQSSSPASLPIIPGSMDTSRPSSLHDNNKLDKECDSPKLKSIFIREPPDGCERIKIIHEESSSSVSAISCMKRPPLKESLFCPIKNPSERCTIPSQDSAFFPPLLKPYVRQASEMALRSSPTTAARAIEGL